MKEGPQIEHWFRGSMETYGTHYDKRGWLDSWAWIRLERDSQTLMYRVRAEQRDFTEDGTQIRERQCVEVYPNAGAAWSRYGKLKMALRILFPNQDKPKPYKRADHG